MCTVNVYSYCVQFLSDSSVEHCTSTWYNVIILSTEYSSSPLTHVYKKTFGNTLDQQLQCMFCVVVSMFKKKKKEKRTCAYSKINGNLQSIQTIEEWCPH